MDERKVLTTEEAIAMLPDGETVHTFRQAAGMLLGADWKREYVIQAIKDNKVELSGEVATNMGHGMVINGKEGHIFVATRGEAK